MIHISFSIQFAKRIKHNNSHIWGLLMVGTESRNRNVGRKSSSNRCSRCRLIENRLSSLLMIRGFCRVLVKLDLNVNFFKVVSVAEMVGIWQGLLPGTAILDR